MSLNGKILVTGGAGFIGSHIVDALMEIRDVDEIVVIDDLSTGRTSNIKHHIGSDRFRFVKDDIRNRRVIHEVMKDVNYVFHDCLLYTSDAADE